MGQSISVRTWFAEGGSCEAYELSFILTTILLYILYCFAKRRHAYAMMRAARNDIIWYRGVSIGIDKCCGPDMERS